MASIRTEIEIDARPEDVWDALCDWGALHERLVQGFVLDTRLDGDDRIVTFFNGATAREVFVDRDDEARRLVWTAREAPLPYEHHNASAQVFALGEDRTRFVWIADVLPHELAEAVRALMERGIVDVKRTLERQSVATS